MEEYEVDLRDYIRVIWQKKWILLAVFLGAVLVAAVFSFRSPDVYETEALLQLENPPIIIMPTMQQIQLQMPSPQLAVSLLKSSGLIAQTVKELGQAQITASWMTSNLTVSNPQGNLLQLRLRGSVDPGLLKQALEKHIALITEELNKNLEKERRRLEQQKHAIVQQIEALKETMRAQSDKLDTFLMWLAFNPVHSRLLLIEEALVNLTSLREGLKTISAPFVPEAPIGPNRRQNMLIGGVLGIFLGVLLAFFVHYMEGGKEQSASLQVSKET